MRYRRRRYIVNSGFQWRFVIGYLTIAFLGSTVGTFFFNHFAAKELEKIQWSVFISAQSTGEVLSSLFFYVNVFNLAFVSLLLATISAWMMKRTKGPLHRIMRTLERIRKGDFSGRILFRRNDEFRDVADALNEMLDQTKERMRVFKTDYDKISQALVALEVDNAKGRPVHNQARRIAQRVQTLERSLRSS